MFKPVLFASRFGQTDLPTGICKLANAYCGKLDSFEGALAQRVHYPRNSSRISFLSTRKELTPVDETQTRNSVPSVNNFVRNPARTLPQPEHVRTKIARGSPTRKISSECKQTLMNRPGEEILLLPERNIHWYRCFVAKLATWGYSKKKTKKKKQRINIRRFSALVELYRPSSNDRRSKNSHGSRWS